MPLVSTRTRLVIAVLLAAVVGAAAAGVVLARGGGNGGLVTGHPGVVARGKFRAVSWATTGTATIARDDAGRLSLRFSRTFGTQRAPELYVYLVSVRGEKWHEVGVLKRAWGSQEYRLPAEASSFLPATVRVFCAKCGKSFGAASLQAARGL
jgi:Electron transfer DM13